MGIRKKPYAFTEQGVAMLSAVLKSDTAVKVSIQIMHVFVQLRQILSLNKELAYQSSKLESKVEKHDHQIKAVFQAILQLMTIPEKPKRKIGFR